MLTYWLRRPQTYTIMNVRDAPRNWMLMKGARAREERRAEKKHPEKSALRPRKVPSSRRRQYRLRKNMWKTKSMPRLPKKKKLVKRRHSWPFLKMRCEL